MHAFLITPDHEALTVHIETIALRDDDAMGCYRQLAGLLEATFPERVVPRSKALKGHVIFVDEDGLGKAPPGHILAPEAYVLPLAGKIVLTGEALNWEGPKPVSVTVPEDVVRRIFANAYVSRAYARAAHDLAERKLAAAHRGDSSVIVVNVSKDM